MRIVLVTSGIRGIGSYCLNLYNYLTSNGHQVLLVSENKWKKQPIGNLYEAKSFLLAGLIPVIYKPKELIETIRNFNPDVIHYHWPSGTMDHLFKRILKLNIPTMVTLHVSIASKKHFFDKIWYMYFGMFKYNLKHVTLVNSISCFVEKQLDERIKLPSKKKTLIYAGINSNVFKPVERKKSQTINLVFVGQIMPEKGIKELVEAVIIAQKKRKIHLKIVGEGHLKKILQIKTKGMDFIEWVGFVKDQPTIAKIMAEADLTVLPTKWDEAFSLVPVESLSCGTPVFATALGGTPEIIFPKKTGYLIKEGTAKDIAEVLINLNSKELSDMRENCRNLILEKFTLERMGKNHEIVYKKLIASNKKM